MADDKILKNFKAEQRKRAVKNWISDKYYKACTFWDNNKQEIITLTPVIIGGLTAVTKVVGKNVNLKREKDNKELYCYDNRLGHYWRLRRELSNSEWLEIDRRKNKGEHLSDILSDLKVLK